ncbi:MAG TPA: hypothetical protein VFR42_09845 [Candidatus Acidoferrum sp.]|nr:hypothetical protein [Candidatus Acidoferrum sp.]
MNDAEARQKRIDEENISTADLAGARTDAATDREVERARRGDIIDVQPDNRNVAAVEVQKTEVTAQAVPVEQVGGSAAAAAPRSNEPERGPLFSAEEAVNLRSRWDAIQVGFVDEPRRSVQEADSLVATAMKRLAEQFAAERSTLEGQWDRGGDVSTEDLRIALRRYRSFFGRLLSV